MESNNVIPVNFNFEMQDVRIVMIDDRPWFVAVDVCNVLNITNTTKALLSVDEEDSTLNTIQGSHRPTNLVNESGLYTLIFKSRKPEAKRFKKWVTRDVLPQIRQTGSYVTQKSLPEMYRELADSIEREEQLRLENIAKKAQIDELHPKAENYDDFLNSNHSMSVGDVAKVLNNQYGITNFGRNKLFNLLRHNKILCDDNTPRQQFIDNGDFTVKLVEVGSNKCGKLYNQMTYVNTSGFRRILELVRYQRRLDKLVSDDED